MGKTLKLEKKESKKVKMPTLDVGANENPQTVALKILRAINKSSITALQLDDVPSEFLRGSNVDLHRWTMVMTDKNLKILAEQHDDDCYTIDCKEQIVPKMFANYLEKKSIPQRLVSLNISHAKEVTNYGIALIARNNHHLKELNITGCISLGDAGLRDVGVYCHELLTLIMSGCDGIEGTGLVALADGCPHLLKLDVSKCKKLQKFSLSKLFFKCRLLEEVNVNYYLDIGDDETRVLAQNCPNMINFFCKECIQISDQTILSLSQYCPDLDNIDLSRTSMTYRITDVSMLSLSERCQSLRKLNLNSCEQVTDVGLTWLASGCHVLEDLDVGDCVKITDAGLRSIGNGCHALQRLDITNCKLVSDVGVCSITSGCPNLRSIVLTGLYLLADPRLSDGNGMSWNTVTGIASIGKYSQQLEEINLTGCFRLNIAIQKHLSKISTLKVLNLTGCNQISQEAFLTLAKANKCIEDLNLSDGGKFVNNITIEAFCSNNPNLRTITLARCEQIKAKAIKAVSLCSRLKKLDLNGCQLTDIMILSITEYGTVPNLRTLSLVNIPTITDTTLAWIASKEQEILLLAVKGTSISKHAIQAVRDRFPQSDMQVDENFVGFWPKFRVDDRKLINKYYTFRTGIIKIQARQRKYLAKEFVKNIASWRRTQHAIAVLQSMCRVCIAKCRVYYKRYEKNRTQRASIRVTTIMWMALAKGRVKKRRQQLYGAYYLSCVIRTQSWWRMQLALECRRKLFRAWLNWQNKRKFGATKMQSIGRVYLAKIRILKIKEYRKSVEAIRDRKAAFIIRVYRGYKGRQKAKARYREVMLEKVTKQVKATIIGKNYRVHRTKTIVKARQILKRRKIKGAIMVQCVIRGFLDRVRYNERVCEKREIIQNTAILTLQAAWRRKQVYLRIRLMKKEGIELLIAKDRSAIVLQKYVRAKLARAIFRQKMEAFMRKIQMRAELEIWAAMRIQAAYRGMLGRIRATEELKIRKGKWKELYDEDKGRRFFYNKLTGEIRWRMPQDLLDLIPHPICDNCSNFEAGLECRECNEVFCYQCFEKVHDGGRRRDHEFRTLYDYYGKRMDYGDGDYPCKWPSEVMQDEIQGWMLRVAPIRDPVKTFNEWEHYEDRDPMGKKRSFYFNRTTYETTYDEPQEVQTMKYEEDYNNTQNQLGYYDASGNWITGYYDVSGTWVSTGYYDTNGNYIENVQDALEYDYKYNNENTYNSTNNDMFATGEFSARPKEGHRASTTNSNFTGRRPDPLTSRSRKGGVKSARK